jgi:hypothetical protein
VRVIEAVVGLFAKTGSAVAVTLVDALGAASLADRRNLTLFDGDERFVFHAAQLLEPANAPKFVRRCTTEVNRRARGEVDALLDDLRRANVQVTRGAIVAPDKPFTSPGLARILASHSLLHTAEGDLYRSAVIDAFDRRGVEVEPIARHDLAARAASAIGRPAARDTLVTALGRSAGPPWRKEHKDATFAALATAALHG